MERCRSLSDMGKLDPNDRRAPYLQVADQLAEAVRVGEYAPGDQLPALSALGEAYGVAVGTVRSALHVLRDKGITVTRAGSGSFIRSDLDVSTLEKSLSDNGSTDSQVLDLLREINDRLIAIEKRLPDA